MQARAERSPRQGRGRAATWDTRRRGILASVAAALTVALAAAGCSAQASASPAGTTVDVELHDFAVRLSRATVPAGEVTFDVRNTGPSTHEFNVVRTALGDAALPLTRGGLSVDDGSPLLHEVGTLGEVALGHHAHLTLDLKPGHYVLYCNLEGHYLGGTRAQIDVISRGSR